MRTYYQILGVSVRATDEEIKRAYRSMAMRHHPDQNPGDRDAEERFKAVAEAYRVLGHPAARRAYDRFGAVPHGAAFAGHAVTVRNPVGDVFRGVASAARRFTKRRGRDIRFDVELDFVRAMRGTERVFELPRRDASGALTKRRLSFTLPAGLRDGQVLRWREQGAPGEPGGRSGDLVVAIRVARHPIFGRRGDDVVAELPVTLAELLGGCAVVVPTLWGVASLTVPPRSQPGDELRVEGGGVRSASPGDAVYRLRLVLPDALDESASAALERSYAGVRVREALDAVVAATGVDGDV